MTTTEKKAGAILGGIAAAEGTWVLVSLYASPVRFWHWMGFTQPQQAGVAGWAFALAVAAAYIYSSTRLPSVRRNLTRISMLKVLALLVALAAGLCEEAIFRKVLMEALAHRSWSVAAQVALSALAFGAVHAVWGLMKGSLGASLGAMIATGSLGLLLALVYVASHRNLAPSVTSHFLINLFAEPGLVLAAVSGEMGSPRAQRSAGT